jgi:plastocyanin
VKPWICLLALSVACASVHALDVQMGVKPGLKFDVAGFHARPGERIKLTFANNDEMMHNIVFTKPEMRLHVVEAAIALGAEGLEKHFVPAIPAVMASTPIIQPGQKFTLEFNAPSVPEKYPYVCTFPGHGFVMHGTLFVANDRPAELDKLLRKAAEEPVGQQTELPLSKAKLVRTFMPGSSPAAIAVALPGGHAYCWDAGNCRMRYAWRGGFIQRNGSYGRWRTLPTLLGPVYYREPKFPFRFTDKPGEVPETQFLGYRFIDGMPEFRYRVGDCEFREFLAKLPGKSGLLRRFSISNLKGGLQFHRDLLSGVNFFSNKGTWKGDVLHLNVKEASSFALEMVEAPAKAPTEYWSMDDLTRQYNRKGSLVEGHLGRAWQFNGSPIISTNHDLENVDQGVAVSLWIRAKNPGDNLPAICGWGEIGQGPTISYGGDSGGFKLGMPEVAPVFSGKYMEAERARVQGAAKTSAMGGFTGNGYVDFQGKSGESIEWMMNVEEAGQYLLRFRYALQFGPGGSRPLKVELDGKVLVAKADFKPTGKNWVSWKGLDFPAKLTAGQHQVRLSSIGSSGPNVDHLSLVRAGLKKKSVEAIKPPDPVQRNEPILSKDWQHFVMNWSNGNASFYLDGTILNTMPFSSNGFTKEAKFYLGPKVRGGSFHLDEARLFSRALTEAEVKELAKR